MKSLAPFLWFLYATLSAAELSPNNDEQSNLQGDRYIIELSKSSDIAQSPELRKRGIHKSVVDSLNEQGINLDVHMEFDSPDIFLGMSVGLKNAADVQAIEGHSAVVAVRKVGTLQRAEPVSIQPLNVSSITTPLPDTQSTHVMTGVDKLHAEGITGKGITIGIIDTGVDYTHPSLGKCFGSSQCKIIGGYDFVGDAYIGSNTPKPDPDPLDQCAGHGTHVAGIIGANPGTAFGISGVAYDAKINAYRVFGCKGFVTDDIIVAALLRAVKDNNDVITLSLGGPADWTESTTSVVASRIAAAGKVMTIAAGNDGAGGAWYTSSPGDGIDVISVASVENTVIPTQKAIVTGRGVQHDPIIYFSLVPLPVRTTLPICATSKDITATTDACSPLPASMDLSKCVAIIRRGTCTFEEKLKNAAARGAKVALIYNNGNGLVAVDLKPYAASLIQAADGEFLVKQFIAGVPVLLTFPQTGGSINFPSPVGGLVSTFSSYGPTDDFYFKPAVGAPGGNIVSTLPVKMGSFGILSGTSMATPFVAGSAALLIQAKGKSMGSPRTLLETTAQGVSSTHSKSDPLQTVAQQGAGLIQVYNAVHYNTVVSPGQLTLNDTAHFVKAHVITVKNNGRSPQVYTVTHVPAGTANTIGRFSIWPNLGPLPLNTQYATASISTTAFKLGPLQTMSFGVRFAPPAGVNPSAFPVYSGFIQIASKTEVLHVPYIGLAASLINKQVIDTIKPPSIIRPDGNAQTGQRTYTFIKDDFPRILYRLSFGTPLLRVDLVKRNADMRTVDASILGPIYHFSYVPRNNEADGNDAYLDFIRAAKFENGAKIPNGDYRLLLRALRVTGNPKNQADYDKWLSPVITIKA